MISELIIGVLFCFISCVNPHPLLKDVNDFVWLTGEPYFIDKTDMLTLIFNDKAIVSNNSHYFITCPYHFGKRKNLYMIKDFASVEVNENGRAKLWLETDALKTFLTLKIGQHPFVISKHLARYPVLLMDLSVSRKDTLDDISRVLNDMLKKSVYDYKWLEEMLRGGLSSAISDFNIKKDDAKFFLKICNRDLTYKELDDGLFRLGKFLYEYFDNREVILLIDEYENVALHALTSINENGIVFYQKLNKMLIRALKDGSKYFKKIVITGTGSLGFSVDQKKYNFFGYTFGSLKRDFITHYAFLDDHPFAPYFGFLEEDLIDLCNVYECKEYEKDTIKKQHRGYLTNSNGTTIYNPSAIARFYQLAHHPQTEFTFLSDHWIDPAWQMLLAPFMRSDVFREKMNDVLKYGVFQYPIKKQLPDNSLQELIKLAKNKFKKITRDHVDMLFTIAFEQGYFSHVPGENNKYSLPNFEIELILRLQFEKFFDE